MIPAVKYHSTLQALTAGQLIAYPTEAVWGLGCDPWNESSVNKLLELKQRDWRKGMIVVFSNYQQIAPIIEQLSNEQRQKLDDYWPGPNTLLIKHGGFFPDWVTGQRDKIALRFSAHPGVQKLCQLAGPIVSTSANLSGKPPCRHRWQVLSHFQHKVAAIAPGRCGTLAQPTSIMDLETGQKIR